MNKWIEIGPRWRSEQACQVMELLKYRHIPSRTVPEEFSFWNQMLHIDPDRIWPVLVRRKDWGIAVRALEQEGLVNRMSFYKGKFQ